jgi:hypothetical protein
MWFDIIKNKIFTIDNNLVDETTMKSMWEDSGQTFISSSNRDKWSLAKIGTHLYHIAYHNTERVNGHQKALGYSGIKVEGDVVFSGAIEVIPSVRKDKIGGSLFRHKMDFIDSNHSNKYFLTHFSPDGKTIEDISSMERYINANMFNDSLIYWPDKETELWDISDLGISDSVAQIIQSGITHANTKGVPFGIRLPQGEIVEPTGEETRISAKPIEDCKTWKDILINQGGPDAPPEERMSIEDYEKWKRLCEEE